MKTYSSFRFMEKQKKKKTDMTRRQESYFIFLFFIFFLTYLPQHQCFQALSLQACWCLPDKTGVPGWPPHSAPPQVSPCNTGVLGYEPPAVAKKPLWQQRIAVQSLNCSLTFSNIPAGQS